MLHTIIIQIFCMLTQIYNRVLNLLLIISKSKPPKDQEIFIKSMRESSWAPQQPNKSTILMNYSAYKLLYGGCYFQYLYVFDDETESPLSEERWWLRLEYHYAGQLIKLCKKFICMMLRTTIKLMQSPSFFDYFPLLLSHILSMFSSKHSLSCHSLSLHLIMGFIPKWRRVLTIPCNICKSTCIEQPSDTIPGNSTVQKRSHYHSKLLSASILSLKPFADSN